MHQSTNNSKRFRRTSGECCKLPQRGLGAEPQPRSNLVNQLIKFCAVKTIKNCDSLACGIHIRKTDQADQRDRVGVWEFVRTNRTPLGYGPVKVAFQIYSRIKNDPY